MLDLICVGNITLDMYFEGENLTSKDDRFFLAHSGKYFVENFNLFLGGGGANVSIGAKRNRLKSAVSGKIGNNSFKETFLTKLREFDIPTDLCFFEENYLNISTILKRPTGERTIINYETPHQHILSNEDFLLKLSRTKAVYFGNLPAVPLADKKKVLSYLKEKGVMIFINVGEGDRCSSEFHDHVSHYADVSILNTHEFSEMIQVPHSEINFKESILNYCPFIKENIFIITDGPNGSFGYDRDHVYRQEATVPEKIVDATGAGDGYTAGFISEFLKSKNIQKSMESGSRYAAEVLTRLGAN